MESQREYILEVSNLGVKLSNQTILDDINFKLEKGTILAIVGPNGAGKTVLFRTLLNTIPYSGKIEWKGRVKIGYVPQILSVHDIPISVKEFLSFKNSSNVDSSLSLVELDGKALSNKSLGVLSGGQLRRVLIAWAIIDEPNVLLFDEPTSGVDIDSEEAIYGMLKKLTKENEMTLLIITHDLHIVKEYSDYMLALNRCQMFFGDSKEIVNASLQNVIFGQRICKET
jgi:zinc transport system ATP-binding protein